MKGIVGHHTTGHTLFVNIKGAKEVRRLSPYLKRFDSSAIAKERLRIITFYTQFGESATKQAFGIGRQTIWVWKQRMKRQGISGLVPHSTAPKTTRTSIVNPYIYLYIKYLRQHYPRLGKSKIKPLLDAYCRKQNLPTVSEATIGRIIKRNNLYYLRSGKVYHNPNYTYKRRKIKRQRIKYAPHPKKLGYIQLDTIQRLEDAIRYYIYSAIDVSGKFALSLVYKKKTAKNSVDFLTKLISVLPYQIHTIQTDNGSEFLGMFEEHVAKNNIKHIFTYPRCPRINGVVERYNRTVQEEFVDQQIDLIHNQKVFSKKLAEYLLFYNTKRVHQSLHYETPMDYILKKGGMSKKY